jgi:alkylation response protein AidB-like acyl-CoA dehydrogenase
MLLDVRKPRNYLDVAVSLSKKLSQSAEEHHANARTPEDEIEQLRESGLLPLVVPKEYGGIGATWVEALKIVQEISKADSLIGQLYGNHLTLTALGHISGTPEQKERYYRETAENNWFWVDAINTRDIRLKIIPDGKNFRINGVVTSGSGVAAADRRVFSAWQEGVEEPLFCIISKDQDGVTVKNNWDNIGPCQIDSSSLTFHNVLVKKDEILGHPNSPVRAFATFFDILIQVTKTYVYLGIAKGAFEAAQEYVKTLSKPDHTSGVDGETPDSYILSHYSDLWMELKAATQQADRVAQLVQAAWEKELTLTQEQRREVAIAVFSAKGFATRIGLDIIHRMFELMGSSPTGTKYSFDRYMQDLRLFGGLSMPWKGAPQHWKLTYLPPELSSILKSSSI